MDNIKFIFASRFRAFIFALVCSGVSCSSLNVAQVSPQNTGAENSNQPTNQPADRQIREPIQNPANSSEKTNETAQTNRNQFNALKSPHQTPPRRRSINFPDGCDFYTADKKFILERGCASAINDVLAELPKTGCGYDSFLSRGSFSDGSSYLYLIEYATDFHPGAIKFYSLSANKYLVEVYCSSGAYNTENVYLFYDESALPARADVLEFPSLELTSDEDADIAKAVKKVAVQTVGGRFFDAKTKELVVFVKANGTGNAGSYARYSFPNGKPKLLEYRAKLKPEGSEYQTDEIIKSPPTTWKRYYP